MISPLAKSARFSPATGFYRGSGRKSSSLPGWESGNPVLRSRPFRPTPSSISSLLTSTASRCELLLFIATFFAFAYFNQGGGWNQNARFAEVRAMVEQGRFAIDDYLVY